MNETVQNESKTTKKPVNKFLFWILALVALGVFAYFVFGHDRNDDADKIVFPDDTAMIEGLPTDDQTVVATINDESLTQGEVNQLINSELIGRGANFDDLSPEEQESLQSQSIELMIDYKVLLQAAYESNVTIDEAEATAQIDAIKSQFTEEEFQEQLTQLNVTEEQLSQTLRDSLIIDAYIQNEVLNEPVTVSEEEIDTQIAQIAEDAGGQAALDAQLSEMGMETAMFRDNVRQGIEAEKQQVVIQTKIEGLRGAATIERN
jgi:hypothetical protein